MLEMKLFSTFVFASLPFRLEYRYGCKADGLLAVHGSDWSLHPFGLCTCVHGDHQEGLLCYDWAPFDHIGLALLLV